MRIASQNKSARRPAILLALACVLLLSPSGTAAQNKGRVAQLERAATLIGGNRLAEAERELNEVLKAAPDESEALNLLGAVRAKQGRLDEAETLFTRAVRARPAHKGAHMNLAFLHLLRQEPEKSAAALREVLRLDPTDAEAAHRLAWLLLSLGRTDECIALIEKLKQTQTPALSLLALLGDAYLRKGDASRAEENYLRALDGRKDNAHILIALAQVAQMKGDSKTAAARLSLARPLVSDSPDLLQKFASAALAADLKAEATAALRRAVELQPDKHRLHFALGAAWLKHPADLQEAEQSFRQTLRLSPEDAQAQLHLGYVLLKQKRHAEAREWLELSVRKGAGTPEAFYYLGLIAQAENEDARAVELLTKSVGLAPAFAHAHVALGATHLKLKDYERARQSLEIAVKLSPEDSKARYNLAMLYARLKQPERAREEMQAVERLKSEGKAREDDGEAIAPPPR
ncbi:MAG TPA: tetratricopeptide repeat protein [Pyrinomonadaceae bacterium]|nr:tetratricopeptide repeat protein [Pyrinomonadaceae bacterium]